MSIAVLLKQVPDTTAKISVSAGRVDESAVSKWSMSPYDEYALESALQLKESGGGDIVAILSLIHISEPTRLRRIGVGGVGV